MPYTFQQSIVDEHNADTYERARAMRARRAYERSLIDLREFERECHEATNEAARMRAKIVHQLIHSK